MSTKNFRVKNGLDVTGPLNLTTSSTTTLTPNIWGAVTGVLNMNGGGLFSTTSGSGLGLSGNMFYNGTTWVAKNAGSGTYIVADADKLLFGTSTTVVSQGTVISDLAERMRIDNVGNVRIGAILATINSPRPLDVMSGTAGMLALRSAGGTDHCFMEFYPRSSDPNTRHGYLGYPSAGSTTLTLSAMNSLEFQSNGTARMSLLTNGYLGLGTTSPTAKMHISDSSVCDLLLDGKSGSWVGSDFNISRSGTLQNLVGQMPFIQMQATDAQYAGGNAVGIGAYANQLQFWRYAGGTWIQSASIDNNGSLNINTSAASVSGTTKLQVNGTVFSTADTPSAYSGFCGANPADVFTTDSNKVISHYGITWKAFSDFAGGSQCAISGYGGIRLFAQGNLKMFIAASGAVTPGSDAAQNLGSPSNRWAAVYAATGSINTSDANLKTEIEDLSTAEKAVAVAIKGMFKKFKFKDAVAAKGSAARIHVGVIAQDVQAAFIAHGLDPNQYALFCSDTFYTKTVQQTITKEGEEDRIVQEVLTSETPQDGYVEVTRLGIRYEELLAFVISAI